MPITRRGVIQTGLAAGAALVGARAVAAAQPGHTHHPTPTPTPTPAPTPAPKPTPAPAARAAAKGYRPVTVPDGETLASKVVGGARVFHLVAQTLTHTIAPGLEIEAWGYNGRTPGPLIECTQGERVRIYVTNQLPERTSVHWHGVPLPNGMDGVAGLTQPAIPPGKTFKYEFTADRAGTFMYHPHFDEMTQIALGMMGMIVVHPRRAARTVARDYALFSHEWKIVNGARRPDPLAMSDFNVLTFNGKAFPATTPLVAETGDRVRIRLANLGPMDHHPIHLHGHSFEVVETDGGPVPAAARFPETAVLVPVGSVRVIEFVADLPGDWPLHCHMTHHVMNQMGHDLPNLVGADTRGLDSRIAKVVPGYMTMGQTGMGDMADMAMPQPDNSISMVGGAGPFGTIDMGGMFTILKIRDRLGAGDPGWYTHPAGTVAAEATAADLARDGVTP
jgi:FtsP/CotA-like multicopper oxidase with cupredoxin domain